MQVSTLNGARVPIFCRPLAAKPGPCCHRVVANRAAVATAENAGDIKWNKTYYPTLADTAKAEKEWFVVDAEGQRLGRLATLVAKYLRGKHSPTYTPSMDMGAMVIVVNAGKVTLTGRKEDQKVYKRHVNGLPGSMKEESFKDLRVRFPEKIIEKAVWGMMPKGRLGRTVKLNMKVYPGTEHPHEAQQPRDITDKINGRF